MSAVRMDGAEGIINMIDKLDANKFQLLLNRIVQAIIKTGFDDLEVFTPAENELLAISLETNINAINKLIDFIVNMFKLVTYNITKPTSLENQLVNNLHMDEDKAKIFSNVWSNYAKSIVQKFKQDSVYDFQLDDVNWMVNITTATDTEPQKFHPSAMIELKVNNLSSSEVREDHVILNLSKEELTKFYDTLETINTRINSLQE